MWVDVGKCSELLAVKNSVMFYCWIFFLDIIIATELLIFMRDLSDDGEKKKQGDDFMKYQSNQKTVKESSAF